MYTTSPPFPFALFFGTIHMFGPFLAPRARRPPETECRCIYPRQNWLSAGRPPLAPAPNTAGNVQKGVGSTRHSPLTLSFKPWVPSKVSLFSPSLCHLLPPPPMIGAAAPFTRSVTYRLSPLLRAHLEVTSLSRTGLQLRTGLGRPVIQTIASIAVEITKAS